MSKLHYCAVDKRAIPRHITIMTTQTQVSQTAMY